MPLFRNLALAALSGWITNLAFPIFGWWPLAVVGLALLWWALENVSRRRAFWVGMAWGLGFFLPHIWWAYTSVGVVPWIALTLLESLAVAFFAFTWVWVRDSALLENKLWLEPLTFGFLWVTFEQVRSIFPFGGFPWGRLAFSQLDGPLSRLAWLGGAALVSFAVAAVGGLLGIGFEALRARRVLLPAAAAFGAGIVTVSGLAIPLDTQAESGTLAVGVVQGNVPNLGLDSFNQARQVLDNHVNESLALAAEGFDLDLVVWAENAADIDPRIDQVTADGVNAAAQALGAPILLGTVDFSPENGRLNTSLLIDEQGDVLDVYHKQHPAPFAEYIPMRSVARIFSSAVDRVQTDMIAGVGVGTVDLPLERLNRTVVVGAVICFEVAYDALVRNAVKAGAEIIVVQTNNASFGVTAESEQQLAMTRLRAIETGRATIQVSTVGVSGIVAPNGRLIDSTLLFTSDYMAAELPLRTSLTPAVRIGAFLDWAFLLSPLAIVAIVWGRSLRGRWVWE